MPGRRPPKRRCAVATARLPAGCEIVGIAVDATSGTFLLADENGRPLTPGVMYNDLRAAAEAPEAADAVRDALAPYGIQVAASFALPKLLHFARHEPDLFRRCRRVIHQTDWIVGSSVRPLRRDGRFDGVEDRRRAGKPAVAGGDRIAVGNSAPPSARSGLAGNATGPRHVRGRRRHGTARRHARGGRLHRRDRRLSGFGSQTAGRSERDAGYHLDLQGDQLTAAARSGWGGVQSPASCGRLPARRCVQHRSRVGRGFFRGEDLERLGREAAARLPTRQIVYPLVKTGERFPFACATAAGFGLDADRRSRRAFRGRHGGRGISGTLGNRSLGALGVADRRDRVRYRRRGGRGNVAADPRGRQRPHVLGSTVPAVRRGCGGVGRDAARGHCREAVAAIVRPDGRWNRNRGSPLPTPSCWNGSVRRCGNEATCDHFQSL